MAELDDANAAGQALVQTIRNDDFITLFCDDGPGFVYSQVTSNVHARWVVAHQQKKDVQHANLANIHSATFQVIGPTKYKAMNGLRKTEAKIEKNMKKREDGGEASMTTEEHQALSNAKQRARIEAEENKQERSRQRGKALVYGQVIQLRHSFSKRYLAVSTTQTSALEPANMQLDLSEDATKKSQFRILPRYKVRSVGDQVRVGDQIQLESIKTEGQFVHCSKSSFDASHIEHKNRELNLSATQSALTVFIQFSPYGKVQVETLLRGGSVVRLFHRELEAYLAAEGAAYKDAPDQDVHLRVRPQVQERPRSLQPSTSGITYWQVELDENPTSGAVVSWGQRVRLKHMVTQKYLSLVSSDKNTHELKLSSCETQAEELQAAFRLYPVIQEDGLVHFESYCRIDHPQSKQWLHALSDQEEGHMYDRREKASAADGDAMSLTALQWDKAQLRRVHVSREMNYNDAFTLQEVTMEQGDSFNFVAGMVPVFQSFLRKVQQGWRPDGKVAGRFKQALDQLSRFQVVNGEPVKDHQKLMRNLQVVDILIETLRCFQPTDGSSSAKDHFADVCGSIYSCLETYLLGDSRKNELYMAKYITFYQSQIGMGLNAETMAMELARDNRVIIDRLPPSQIDRFIQLLSKRRDPRYLDFLGVLCVCDGIAIPNNQEYICRKLLEVESGVVYLTDPTKDKKSMTVSVDNGRTRLPLGKFAKDGGDGKGNGYDFLEAQLDLFGKLCYGRNEYVIEVITEKLGYLTKDEVLICLKDENLPTYLRAKYCELLVGMFVDVEPNYSALETLELSFIFSDVREDPAALGDQVADTSITGARLDFFPELRKWLAKYMQANMSMTASEIGDNELLGEVLRLLRYLVAFGYYSDSRDIEELLTPLLGVLDGRNDMPFKKAKGSAQSEFSKKGRFEQSPQNKAVVDAKYRAMEVLEVFFNFAFNVRLEAFIFEFKDTVEGENKNGVAPSVAAYRHMQSRSKGGFSSVRMHNNAVDLRYNINAVEDGAGSDPARTLLADVSSEVIYSSDVLEYARFRLHEQVYGKVRLFKGKSLEKILLDLGRYKYDKMVVKGVELLDRFYSTHAMLFEKAIQGQVLINAKSIDIFTKVKAKVQRLRRLTTAKLTRDMEITMSDIIDEFTQYCCVRRRSSNEPTDEPHPMNQKILLNFGVIDDIFNVLDKQIDVKLLDTQYAGLREIFRKSFIFLRAMASRNAPVQAKIYERLDKLLEVPGCPQELGLCVAEVFTGNQDLCLAVKPDQVRRIVELVARIRQKGSELLQALNAIVKVEELDLPLKRNQAAVVTFINQNRSRVAWILQPKMQKERMSLLHDGQECNEMLCYLVNLVDVLATCAEGENRFIESMCQNIFTVEEILQVLNDPQIAVWCKRPYLRFFVWCYLNTAGGKVEAGCVDMDHDPDMWRFLTIIQGILQALCKGFNNFSRTRAASLRDTLRSRRSTVSSKSSVRKPGQKGAEEITLSTPGILPFVFEGVLPLLNVYYASGDGYFVEHTTAGDEVRVSGSIATFLLTLYESMSSVVANINHYNLMKTAIGSLISYNTISVPDQLVAKFQRDSSQVNPDLRSDPSKEYAEDFFDEEDLNTRLNRFVANFQTAYQGRNTVREQIHEPYDDEYCEDGGDEDLPRGQEFQFFVHLFQHDEKVVEEEVRKLVDVLYISFHSPEYRSIPSAERDKLDIVNIKCLQILRALIHNKTAVRAAMDVPGGSEAALQRFDKMIGDTQVSINSHGTTQKILPLLSHSNDAVVRETLALMSMLLFNAQRDVQASFVDYCLGTREEQFFRDVSVRLQRSAVALKERRALRSQFQAKLEKDKATAKTVAARTTAAEQTEGKTLARAAGASDEIELRERMREETGDPRGGVEDSIGVSKDDGYIELVLRILAGLCDGQQRTIQNYLRQQPDNIKSINLVSETVNYLHLFKEDVNVDNVNLVVQILQTLVEFTSGNTDNQACVFDSQLIEAANSILRTDWKDNMEMMVEVVGVLMDLLRNLVELSVPATKQLAKLVGDTIHYESLYNCLGKIFRWRANKEEAYDVVGYRIVHFVKRLNDFLPKKKQFSGKPDFDAFASEHKGEWASAWQHYEKNTLSVEVMNNGCLQRVYFATEVKGDLRDEVKEQMKWNVERDSAANKLRDFLKWSEDIREDMEYQGQLSRNAATNFFVKNSFIWSIALLGISVFLNVFVLVMWRAPSYLWDVLPEVPSWYDSVIYGVGSVHLVMALFVCITFFIANLKNFYVPWFIKWPTRLFLKRSDDDESNVEKHNELSIIGVASVYHLCLVGFSAASIPLRGYFYCFHLLHIVVGNDLLNRVLQSVIRPGRQLIWVTILALCIIYIYAVASFGFLRIFFDRNEGLFCENLGQCFVTSIRFGLLSTLGDVIPGHNNNFRTVGVRIIFDLTFFIIITTIALNIVFGLIVDSFSALRDEKNEALQDMTSVCFMCAKSSHEFDKYGQGFEHHVKHDHNMWAYLFFFIFLHSLDVNDMTSTEFYIFRKLKKEDIDFFPTNKALCLENVDADGKEERLDQLVQMVGRLIQRIEREEDEERRSKAREEQRLWEQVAHSLSDDLSLSGSVIIPTTAAMAGAKRTAARATAAIAELEAVVGGDDSDGHSGED